MHVCMYVLMYACMYVYTAYSLTDMISKDEVEGFIKRFRRHAIITSASRLWLGSMSCRKLGESAV